MTFRITLVAPMSTVQDLGRSGYMSYGFQASGALNQKAHILANYLVGNSEEEASLELNFFGVSGTFEKDAVFSLTGADVNPMLNGKPINMYQAIFAKSGDNLTCSSATDGMRTYMAFHSGIKAQQFMGSYSTNLKCGIGGLEGRALKVGDVISTKSDKINLFYLGERRLINAFDKAGDITVRVILGPQLDSFTQKGIETFLNSKYTLTKDCDRMGLKLDGAEIETKKGSDIISDGIPLGAVQIPQNGKPIIMLNDRQTTGGYAKIATVISSDIDKLASMRFGDSVSFESITVEKAHEIYLNEKSKLEILKNLWVK